MRWMRCLPMPATFVRSGPDVKRPESGRRLIVEEVAGAMGRGSAERAARPAGIRLAFIRIANGDYGRELSSRSRETQSSCFFSLFRPSVRCP